LIPKLRFRAAFRVRHKAHDIPLRISYARDIVERTVWIGRTHGISIFVTIAKNDLRIGLKGG
jgi:hypothetical protein